jgi:peptide-methionine (S)-S-oxide reductase
LQRLQSRSPEAETCYTNARGRAESYAKCRAQEDLKPPETLDEETASNGCAYEILTLIKIANENEFAWETAMPEIATFGAGCFWGIEAAFQQVPGVIETAVGYSGGEMPNPTYKDVCTDETGHAEVVQVTFDPPKASYEQLLDVFWKVHDPTQVNRQGPDFGSQYRTAIFFHSPAQEAAAKKSREALEASGKFKRPIATEITPAGTFYRAEEYHQKYLQKRGVASCHF